MRKLYDNLFTASFLTYIVYLLKSINTQQKGEDFAFFICIFAIGILYQFVYIVFLRKQSDIKLGRAIARYFLYALNTLSLTTLIHGLDLYLFGYDVYSWILPVYIRTVYRMDALRESWFFLFTYLWIVNGIYVSIYYYVSQKLNKSSIK